MATVVTQAAKTFPIAYSDLDLSFKPHPMTGDLVPKTNAAAVLRSAHDLFLMNAYDIPFDAYCGDNLKDLLFEPVSQLIASTIQTRIEYVFKKYEPRGNLVSSSVTPDSTAMGYDVSITFNINSVGSKNVTETFHIERIH